MNANRSEDDIERRILVEVLEPLERGDTVSEIRAGLLKTPREISSKFFYDNRGSALFERICELPEYYPTRTERALLERNADRIVEASGADVLVELGSGSSTKTRILLDAMERAGHLAVYAPIDVNESFVQKVAVNLTVGYPGLRVHGVAGDFVKHLECFPDGGRRLVIFLGGTIGNFRPSEAISILFGVCEKLRPGEFFLLGADLIKDVNRLEAAYNDSQGVTAEFNLNILRVLNGLVDSDFDPGAFEHRAFYSRETNWIEMRLRSTRRQHVRLNGIDLELELQEGEEILTEISSKYDRGKVGGLLEESGFEMIDWMTDPDDLFSLSLARKL